MKEKIEYLITQWETKRADIKLKAQQLKSRGLPPANFEVVKLEAMAVQLAECIVDLRTAGE
jgi:hypothetical protein